MNTLTYIFLPLRSETYSSSFARSVAVRLRTPPRFGPLRSGLNTSALHVTRDFAVSRSPASIVGRLAQNDTQ